jgi:hypothetical protein
MKEKIDGKSQSVSADLGHCMWIEVRNLSPTSTSKPKEE